MHSFLRVVKAAFQDMGRNLGLSFMTVFILVLMLLSVNTLWSMDAVTKEAVRLVKNEVNISFYLNPLIVDKDLQTLQSYVAAFPEVVDVHVMSRDEVLRSFQQRHQFSSEVLQALNELGSNPFGPTLVVKTREPEDYKKIIDALNVPEYDKIIDGKSFEGHEDALDKIQTITNKVEQAGLGLSLLFAVIAFLIIFNTVRVAIATQRVEISIKRLVGASNWFIRGPYLVESVIFTVIRVVITLGITYFATHWLDVYLGVVFPNTFSLSGYYNEHLIEIFGVQVLAVLVLTIVSSLLAMRRQLKV